MIAPVTRRRTSVDKLINSMVGTLPRRPSLELYGAIHVPHPRDFQPLLYPDGPFYGSGL